jgi:hypothetical protein
MPNSSTCILAAALALCAFGAAAQSANPRPRQSPQWFVLEDGDCSPLPAKTPQRLADLARRDGHPGRLVQENGTTTLMPLSESGGAAFEPVVMLPTMSACQAQADKTKHD